MKISRASCFILGFAAALGRAWGQAAPSDPAADDLKNLSLEDLMAVEVTSVSRYPERLLDAPSAIQVISGDDVLRSGATSLPEALRLADNLEVAQENSHDWAISARGFNANLANKLLVLIDGRAVYTPLYGGVLWNVQDTLLEDLDRIEVISGPGGTQWGANAVNGVINITTKSSKETQGAYLTEAAGGELRDQTAARYGFSPAPGVYARVYGEYADRGSEELSNGSSADDSWIMSRGGFRVDSEAAPASPFTIQGDVYSGVEFLGAQGDEDTSGGNLLGRWSHSYANGSDMSLTAYYDRTHLAIPEVASPPALPYYTGFPASTLVDNLDTYNLDFQDHIEIGARNPFVWGLSYRYTHEIDTDLNLIQFFPTTLDQNLFTGFAQYEIPLAEKLRLTFGSKMEHNDYTGFEVEPSVRLLWTPDARQSLWAAVSRAVRTPSRYDRDLIVPTGLVNPPAPYEFPITYLQGSKSFASEDLLAYEAGYRADFGPVAGSLSAFYNNYTHLRSTAATPTTADYPYPLPIVFENQNEGDTYGLEFTSEWRVAEPWRLHAGYDLLRENIHAVPGYVDATGSHYEVADPEGQFFLRSSWDLPGRIQIDGNLRWIDSLIISEGPNSGTATGEVPAYWELDARIAWQVNRHLELAVVGQNLLHARHQEYGYPSPATEYIYRTAYGKITWRY